MKLAWILGTALSLTATTACAPVDDTGAEQEALGTASLAISAIGPDGHQYRLPAGTTFVARTPEGNNAFSYPLFDFMDRQTLEFETGSYVAVLEGARSSDGNLMLTRMSADGTNQSTVAARQVSPDPLPFTIRPGQTTQLTFRFAVPQLGDVVFSAGSVDVGIDVESEAEPSHGSSFDLSANMTVSQVYADVAAAPGLQALVDGTTVGEAASASLGLFRTGEWRLLPEGFCADVSLGYSGGPGGAPLTTLLIQPLNATGSFCFMRESAGGHMLFNVGRDGAPYAGLSPEFGFPDPIRIRVEGYGDPADTFVEGGVLHLSQLDDIYTIENAGITITVEAGSTTLASISLNGRLDIGTQL